LQPYLQIYPHTRPYTGLCLYTIITCIISDVFHIQNFINSPFPTHHDARSMLKMSAIIGIYNCISEVSWYVCRIVINGNIEHFMLISQADWSEMHCNTWGDVMYICQQQISEATMLGKFTQLRLMVAETILSWFRSHLARRCSSDQVGRFNSSKLW